MNTDQIPSLFHNQPGSCIGYRENPGIRFDSAETLMSGRAGQKQETFGIGIGINTGSAIVGNVGSENRINYTAIGDPVNIAAKLQQIAKGGEILIGEETCLQTKGQFPIREKGKIMVKNKTEPIRCYWVIR